MATEIANAYIALTVKAPGVKSGIEGELGKVDAESAGGKIGDRVGSGISGRSAAIAGAVGGLVASVANQAAGAFTDLIGDAIEASDATDKFRKTLEFAGLDTSAVDGAMAASKSYADQTVYDLGTIQNTTAQLAANGVDDYSALTEAAGNLNAVAGGSPDTFKSVAMMLSQTAGAGKLTTENWNQLADAIPGASGVMQDAMEEAGAYTGNFREAMEQGEITADEFNAALMEVGTDPIAVEAAQSTETMEGALGNLQAEITGGLADAFTAIKPYLTDFIGGISSVVGFIKENINWIGPLAGGIAIVAGAIGVWTAVQWLLNAALTANPIGLIVVGIGLLIGAIILLVQNWDTVVAWITEIWGGFISWITEGIDGFVAWWNGVWEEVGNFFSDMWNGLVDIVKGIWNNILSFIEDGINGAIDLINGLTAGIRDVAGFIGIEVGTMPHVSIPKLAEGGVVSKRQGGTLAVVGEGRYDEAVIPLSPQVLSQIGGGGGGKGDTFNVYPTPGMDEYSLAKKTAQIASFERGK